MDVAGDGRTRSRVPRMRWLGTPLLGRQEGSRDEGSLGCDVVRVKEESKGIGRQLEHSPGSQMRYFPQGTKIFALFYFSYITPCSLEAGLKKNKNQTTNNKIHVYLLLVTQNLAWVLSKC